MKFKRLLLLVGAIAALSTVLMTAAYAVNFVDNFDDGYQSWLKWDGVDTYMVDDNPGELRLNPPGPDTEVRITSKDKFLYGVYEIVFRSTNDGWNYLYFGFFSRDPWVNPSVGWRVDGNLMLCLGNGPGQANWDALNPNSPYLVPNVWHTLKLTWQPGLVSAVYDGDPLGSATQFVTDTPLPLIMDVIRYTTNSTAPLIFEVDSITVSDLPTTFSLSGTVDLLDFSGDKTAVTGTVEIGANSYPLVLDNDGKFTITDVEPGTYDVRIKASHWLAKTTTGVVVSGDTVIPDPISLINGDVVDSNEVDFDDINATRAAYGSFPGDETWNALADVDGSEEIDFTDINIVRGNYGAIGD
jgi:hypothetical protein